MGYTDTKAEAAAGKAKSYREHSIFLNRDFTFSVSGPLFHADPQGDFKSLDAALKAIDDRRNAQAEEERAGLKIAVAILNRNGEAAIVTGFHRGHGRLKTTPEIDTQSGGAFSSKVYPDVPWIREALAERQEISERAHALDELLHRAGIQPNQSGADGAAEYKRKLDAIERRLAECAKCEGSESYRRHKIVAA